MIIVCLQGGLGNQLFQYAAGRRLACVHDVPLKLDLSWFGKAKPGVTPRSYALGHFSIHAELATDQEIAKLYEPHAGRILRVINLLNPRYKSTHIRRHNSRFDPAVLLLPDDIYLEGYWQSEKYFSDVAHVIRSDFKVSTEPQGRNREIASEIMGCNAISVHIRRGDYVTDFKTAAYHSACSMDYFIKAVELIQSKVDGPHFFVFSDDHSWVREHFAIPYPMTLVDHNGPDNAHEDLRLMSLCRHHIIANSSLSWWGAWLNPRPDKIVTAPLQWFNDPAIDTSSLIPASWLRIAE